MADSNEPGTGLFHAMLAAVLALIAAGLITSYECGLGTTDQCLMSKGFFPYYWGLLFLLLWPLVAAVGKAVRAGRRPRGDRDS